MTTTVDSKKDQLSIPEIITQAVYNNKCIYYLLFKFFIIINYYIIDKIIEKFHTFNYTDNIRIY